MKIDRVGQKEVSSREHGRELILVLLFINLELFSMRTTRPPLAPPALSS